MKEGTGEYTLKIERVKIRDGENIVERYRVIGGGRVREYDNEDVTDPFESSDNINRVLMQKFYEANKRIFQGIPNLTKLELKVTEIISVTSNSEKSEQGG